MPFFFNYPHECSNIINIMKQKNESLSAGLVEVFNFNENSTPIRVQVINDEPWFVAKDVAKALGYSNPSKATTDHCKIKGVTFRDSPTEGGIQKLKYINEGNVYRLIINSNMPKAEEFEAWIFDEVLPSIRKRGYYGVYKSNKNDYIDARDIPYETRRFNDSPIRCVTVDNEVWCSMNDLHAAMGSRTESTQAAKKLNAKQTLAKKIWLFGSNNPGWFVTMKGAMLLLCASRKMTQPKQLELTFTD